MSLTHETQDDKQEDPTLPTLIICDDHRSVAEGMGLALAAYGFSNCGVVASAEEALDLVQIHCPDIVLMDIYLRDSNGLDSIRDIKMVSPSTRVAIFTGSEDGEGILEAFRRGASAYLVKGQEVRQIASALHSILAGNVSIPERLAQDLIEQIQVKDLYGLTSGEREVLQGLASGRSNRSIAQNLGLSERTVRRRIESLLLKLHLHDRVEAAGFGREYFRDSLDR